MTELEHTRSLVVPRVLASAEEWSAIQQQHRSFQDDLVRLQFQALVLVLERILETCPFIKAVSAQVSQDGDGTELVTALHVALKEGSTLEEAAVDPSAEVEKMEVYSGEAEEVFGEAWLALEALQQEANDTLTGSADAFLVRLINEELAGAMTLAELRGSRRRVAGEAVYDAVTAHRQALGFEAVLPPTEPGRRLPRM